MYSLKELAASLCRAGKAPRRKKKVITFIFTLLNVLGLTSALETYGLPAAPAGMSWQKVDILSDEFDDEELDSTKWDDYHPNWSGRPPSEFKKGNAYVQDGNLCLKSGLRKDPSTVSDPFDDIWVDAAACVSKEKSAKVGYYYEACMKASDLSMTSSFWFRVGNFSEIDVIEHIGNPSKDSRDDDLPYEYHANTHVYGSKTGDSIGKGWVMPTRGRDEYHLYGFWWKDANTLWFYHNGEKVMEITPSVPFNENLKMVFDTEVFPFATAGVASIGLPLVENLNDDTKNTMYVDYVRTFELVENLDTEESYTGTPIAIPGLVEAENYNKGGEGVAYHDTEAENKLGEYRTDGVDVEVCSDTGGGHNIGWIAKDEWLNYTITAANDDEFDLIVRAASATAGGSFRIKIDGVDVTGAQSVPVTGGWQSYTDVAVRNIPITAGEHVLQFYSESSGYNLNKITVTESNDAQPGDVVITGELKKWHNVTLTFDGPTVAETDTTNPFSDYRLNVTFTNGTTTLIVPGFFAADGDAANTSAASGNKWRVRFAPPLIGTWNYIASFRTGTDVALSTDASAGTAVSSIDGTTGTFSVIDTDKTGRDLRGKGRLQYVGEHYLRFAETGEYFVKAGADSPENLLAYDDFDATPNSGSRRKSWSPHQSDYIAADAVEYTWSGGKGSELLGAIKYLSDKGMNAFSTLLFNIDGDDKNIYPHLQSSSGATSWTGVHHERFDVSKMAQWERIFSYGDKKGMYLHFKLTETENEMKMDNGATGRERKLYLREMIARYGHHLAFNWNLGEENGHYGTTNMNHQQRRDMATYIKEIDPYDNHIVVHTAPDKQDEIYPYLTGNQSELTGVSLQTSKSTIHSKTLKWYNESAAAGKKWVVACDEQGGADSGVACDASWTGSKGDVGDNRKEVREKVLWANLMAGGAGVEYYFGYQTGATDLTAQDWRSREKKWDDAKVALDFFNTYLPFNEMSPMDGITSTNSDYVFGKAGEVYAVYLSNGGSTNITLPSNDFFVQWYNPRSGGALTEKTSVAGSISAPDTSDWVALITKTVSDGAQFEDIDGLVVIEAENTTLAPGWAVKTDMAGYTGEGYLEYTGNNSMGSPTLSTRMTYKVRINNPGTYRLRWHSRNGAGAEAADAENDTWLMIDGDEFYGLKNGVKTDSTDHYMKVWIQSMDAWSWNMKGEHSGVNSMDVYVIFNNPGVYDLNICGRSKGHVVDRIVLFKTDVSNPTNLANEETSVDGEPPVIDNPPVVSLSGPANGTTIDVGEDLVVTGTASVQGSTITAVELYVDGVLADQGANASFSFTKSGLAAGDHTFYVKAIAANGKSIQTGTRTITVKEPVVLPPGTNIKSLMPAHDAYLQGTTRYDNVDLRVEAGNRVSYLQFDLSSLSGTISSMKLKLTVGSDAGNGTVNIAQGSNSDWTESNLSSTSKPAAGAVLDQSSGALALNQTYEYDVTNAVVQDDKVTFVVTMSAGGNDVSFASKENTGKEPELVVTTVVGETAPHFSLHEGYQIVSLNFVPEVTNIKTLFQDHLGQIEFIQAENKKKLYKNGAGEWVNEIINWDSTQAYLIKAKGTVEFDVAKSAAPMESMIDLVTGVNLIPVHSSSSEGLATVFDSILESHIIWIRDVNGKSLRNIDDNWIDSIKEIEAGSGLIIKVSGDCSFEY